ncbi:DNA polymerase I [hydrothermal vent metagenome]|uniref:DNA-directed DNA polymerase n=1 Tax=hydrothermal vent metagenome TaxID=652676 RepID=A0A3B0TKE1_9ZZZZ
MHVLLVDGSTFIFRAYHALPPLTRKSDGLPIGAVAGFCNMLFKLVEDFNGDDAPTHIAVIFDHSGKSFRNDFYPLYKAHRPPAPDDLIPQFPLTRAATRAFSIISIEQEGFEADDLIATYATMVKQAGGRTTIVSSDKDLMQLIDDDGSIRMLDTLKNRWIGPDEVEQKFGVGPDKVIEVQSLAGDSVDNVPGVPGIGLKTAALLINQYGDLENLLANANEITQNKRRQNLIEFAEQARISHQLVRLKTDVPVEHCLADMARQPLAPATLIPFLKAMELNRFSRRVAGFLEADETAFEPDPELAAKKPPNNSAAVTTNASDPRPQEHAKAVLEKIKSIPVDYDAYEIVRDEAALAKWIEAAYDKGHIAVDTETTGLDNQSADLVGICLAVEPGKACYIPLAHTLGQGDMFGAGMAPGQMDLGRAIEMLKPLFADHSILKILQNAKYDLGILSRYGVNLTPIDDTMLLSYAMDGARGNSMDALSQTWLDHAPMKFTDLAGSGKAQKTFDQLEINEAAKYAAEDADITLRLWHVLKARLVPERSVTLYETLERPLVPVLARMEARGIVVDKQILARLSGDFAQRAAAFEAEAHQLAGEKFNLASPKQLGEILFGKMELAGGKKTKTGAWATGVGVLEDLATKSEDEKGAALARTILDWRSLSKLKSTYTDSLPAFINARTGRVHTSYHQASVLTGRLASSDPNLQNIPIRTEDGRKIRTAFVAQKGHKLISADYSQIELRILAHIADIKALKKAFADGLDIHAMTASEIFGVPVQGMDPSVRRRAKAINFGIIYGISAFGLANQLGISRSEAGDYIKAYFEKFPGIKDYMEAQKALVKEQGFVETIFGRKIKFSNVESKNPAERAFIERAAINAPIQGAAADIIRRAMIHMEPALAAKNIAADMLLQVHDELIFEVAEAEVEAAIPAIDEVMIKAPEPAVLLAVPLQVDAKAADNWDEAH